MKILFVFSILLIAISCQLFTLSLSEHKTTPRNTFFRMSDTDIKEFFAEMEKEKSNTVDLKTTAAYKPTTTDTTESKGNNVIQITGVITTVKNATTSKLNANPLIKRIPSWDICVDTAKAFLKYDPKLICSASYTTYSDWKYVVWCFDLMELGKGIKTAAY